MKLNLQKHKLQTQLDSYYGYQKQLGTIKTLQYKS